MTGAYPDGLVTEARRPSGAGALADPRRSVRAENPLCGDEIELDLDEREGVVSAVAHRTRGCAFTVASASILARDLPGLTIAEALARGDALRAGLAGAAPLPAQLEPLGAVRMYPTRVRCALLPWEALRSMFQLDPAP